MKTPTTPGPTTTTSGWRQQSGLLLQDQPPESQPLQSTDSHAQAPALTAATHERWQRPQSNPNMVHSMRKPVKSPLAPEPTHIPTTTRPLSAWFRFTVSYWAAPEPNNPLIATRSPSADSNHAGMRTKVLARSLCCSSSSQVRHPLKMAPWELTVISTVLLHPYLVFAGLRVWVHPLPACNPLDVCPDDRYAMTAALYQQQSRTLAQRGCPLKAIWFQPSVSVYSPDTRGPMITKPNPTTPHSSRSDPRPCCTDPAAISFTT